MYGFEQWKKGFDQWEQTTAKVFEEWLKSPLVLEPSGLMLSAVMKMKKATDAAWSSWWGAVGLPTKRDQERTLHELHRMQSRLIDLEEKLEAAHQAAAPTVATTAPPMASAPAEPQPAPAAEPATTPALTPDAAE